MRRMTAFDFLNIYSESPGGNPAGEIHQTYRQWPWVLKQQVLSRLKKISPPRNYTIDGSMARTILKNI
jgi:hypothetical protein